MIESVKEVYAAIEEDIQTARDLASAVSSIASIGTEMDGLTHDQFLGLGRVAMILQEKVDRVAATLRQAADGQVPAAG